MKKICVLMSTYNGEKYLKQQIESILKQEGVEVELVVRDDGSTDSTVQILENYRIKNKIKYFVGKNIGYAKSFMTLLQKNIDIASYYAFCDQDDIWKKDKLISAINRLQIEGNEKYKLYFSNLILVDQNLNYIGMKDYSNLKSDLKTAMVRFNISGCTMVFNNELAKEISRGQFLKYNISHDSWCYKICLALGGRVVFDKNSYIMYRQHNNNVTGIKQGIIKRVKRELTVFNGKKNDRLNQAKIIRQEYAEFITKENSEFLDEVISYQESLNNTLKLAFKKDFKIGIRIVDLLTFFQIISRRY